MSASWMNGAVVLFLATPDLVAEVVEKGTVIQGMYTAVLPMVSPYFILMKAASSWKFW